MKFKLLAVAIAVLIAVVFYILMLLVDDPNYIFASSFVFGLSFSLLMGRGFKRHSTAKQIDDAFKKAIAREQRQGGLLADHCTTDIDACKKRFKGQGSLSTVRVEWGLPRHE